MGVQKTVNQNNPEQYLLTLSLTPYSQAQINATLF